MKLPNMLAPGKIITPERQAEDGGARPSNNAHSSPGEPVIRIRPAGRWGTLNLGELWEHHELFYFFVWRDLKTRYKQTALGAAWVVLQPLLPKVRQNFLGISETPGTQGLAQMTQSKFLKLRATPARIYETIYRPFRGAEGTPPSGR